MKRKLLELTEKQIEEISDHAISSYPTESCGVIKDGLYIRLHNVATNPYQEFKLSDHELDPVMPVEAVVHSHPNGLDCPSAADMKSQASMDVPFVIVTTDGGGATTPFVFDVSAIPSSLETRVFRHGVTDCYALIRDWFYVEKKIELMDGPRDWEWWGKDRLGDLYLENYQDAGFSRLKANETMQAGDLFFMKTPYTRTINHAGVYLGNDTGFHHTSQKFAYDPSCVPCKFSILRWKNYIKLWVRYDA